MRLRALRYDCDEDALRRAGRPRRARLPHRRADLLPPRRHGRAARRGAGRARADDRGPPGRRPGGRATRPSSSPTPSGSARRCARRPSEVAERRADESRRARGGGGRRRALPPVGADGLARPEPARRLRGAEPARGVIPSLEEVRALAREHTLVPLRHTYVADTETPVSAYLKLRGDGPVVPARVRRAGPALRALVVPRLPAAGGAPLEPGRRRGPLRAGRARAGPLQARAGRGPAPVRRRSGGHVRLRPRPLRRAHRWGRPTRTSSGCPTWR